MRTKRIHLKGEDGCFMTPTEETAAYVDFIQKKWSGPTIDIPEMPPPDIPFAQDELEQTIAAIHQPRQLHQDLHLDPNGVLSRCSFKLAFSKLQSWWSVHPPYIPQTWRDGWSCWLPKPHKPPTRLENLRMIGLQEPLGKAGLKLIAKKSFDQTFRWLRGYPQFAYLPFRRTREAILHGAFHCQAVRHLLNTEKRSIHATTVSQPRLHCAGGIMLFIDLTRAFDEVPRQTSSFSCTSSSAA